MTELFTTQPAGVAAILAALGFLISAFARLVLAGREQLAPISAAVVEAIKAWTRRTNEERDCAPKLREALSQLAALRDEVLELRRAISTGSAELDAAVDVVEVSEREPTGDQRLPAGISPRRRTP